MFKLQTKMLKDEFWYGGCTNSGFKMPVGKMGAKKILMTQNMSYGQANPLYVSNQGRIIFSQEGFDITFCFGSIKCVNGKAEISIMQAEDKTLRGAFLLAVKEFMPADGKYPNEIMFKIPQYCTWIQLGLNQNQKDILAYAKSILDCGMPAGELIIDDSWQETFGEWTFKKEKFPDPKQMITDLKELGFKVILWICPFISKTAKDFNYLLENNLLVKDASGGVVSREWWNGSDYLLDFSNPMAQKWFFEQTDYLTEILGVDGFKQDAGDAMYYKDDDITYGNVDANNQSYLWAQSALKYDFNELRACFKCGCMGIAQRLADKGHRWDVGGIGALLPNALTQGIMGYAFTCPDMIGGGLMGDFRGSPTFDHELFARYCQTSALMPMMQYSLAIWDLGNERTKKVCQEMTDLHAQFSDYFIKYVKIAAITGEPIVRYMEYSFPNRKYAKIKSQFVLGDDVIVAPVLKKGAKSKTVYVPEGDWSYNGKIYSDEKVEIPCKIEELIYLKRVEK